MNIATLLLDKNIKTKEKTEVISRGLLDKSIDLTALLAFAETAKDPVKATCIEALEFATQQQADIATKEAFILVSHSLTAKAPRVKWESAKVIANTAHLFMPHLNLAIENLLNNTHHEGTVVRWSAALALGKIAKLKTPHQAGLLSAIEAIMLSEEKNSIKKIYADAIKKAAKQ